MEGINSDSLAPADNIVQQLLEEDLQREIERNAAANRIAIEREKEAITARQRAAESQRMMKEMVQRYESMKKKLDFTKKALEDTNNRIETQERVTAKLDNMKKRLTDYSDRKDVLDNKDKQESNGLLPLLTEEAEGNEPSGVMEESRQNDLKEEISDHTTFLKKLQGKLVEEEEKLKKKAELREWLEKQVELGEKKAEEQARIAQEKEDILKMKEAELQQKLKSTGAKPKQMQKSKSKSKSCTPKLGSPEPAILPTNGETAKEDIQETVKKIEGKCATVRGDLADMAMSEQYLRTKQALLLAKKKEKEKEAAEKVAGLREQEVINMREKVKQMQDMLNNRKLKLKITEDIMEKKDMQKTRIEKISEKKRQKEKLMEKQLVEKKLFE